MKALYDSFRNFDIPGEDEESRRLSYILHCVEFYHSLISEPSLFSQGELIIEFADRNIPPELWESIQWLEAKMRDRFPNEPLDQYGMRADAGSTQSSMVRSDFERLRSDVALLEICIDQFRRQQEAAPLVENDIGPGHNRGPELGPLSDEDINDVEELVSLLKEQSPVPPQETRWLIEQSEKANKVLDKLKQYLDAFALEFSKNAGGELGKELVRILARVPFWVALYHAISRVTEALNIWLAHVH
jgi:hypothetical protein